MKRLPPASGVRPSLAASIRLRKLEGLIKHKSSRFQYITPETEPVVAALLETGDIDTLRTAGDMDTALIWCSTKGEYALMDALLAACRDRPELKGHPSLVVLTPDDACAAEMIKLAGRYTDLVSMLEIVQSAKSEGGMPLSTAALGTVLSGGSIRTLDIEPVSPAMSTPDLVAFAILGAVGLTSLCVQAVDEGSAEVLMSGACRNRGLRSLELQTRTSDITEPGNTYGDVLATHVSYATHLTDVTVRCDHASLLADFVARLGQVASLLQANPLMQLTLALDDDAAPSTAFQALTMADGLAGMMARPGLVTLDIAELPLDTSARDRLNNAFRPRDDPLGPQALGIGPDLVKFDCAPGSLDDDVAEAIQRSIQQNSILDHVSGLWRTSAAAFDHLGATPVDESVPENVKEAVRLAPLVRSSFADWLSAHPDTLSHADRASLTIALGRQGLAIHSNVMARTTLRMIEHDSVAKIRIALCKFRAEGFSFSPADLAALQAKAAEYGKTAAFD